MGAERSAVIKNQRNQRKGTLTARQRVRYEVVSQDETCPSLSEAQGPDQEKKARLEGRRREQKRVSTRLSNILWARHHLQHLYQIRWGSCPPLGHQSRGATLGSTLVHAVSKGTEWWLPAP